MIVNLININYINLGSAIFKSYSRPNENNKDPFRPMELENHKSNVGAPPKSPAKPRKPSRILKNADRNTSFSEEKEVQKELERIFVMQRYYKLM